MASRRDELNAYTFARKRTVGAFLLPSGGGSDEDAPRPLKAVLPSVIVAALVVGGFGVWGVFKPSAPVNWDNGKNIVQGKKSTTRYVVLVDPDGKTKRLHQVLNMASARLVLPVDAKVVVVADTVLDAYPNHGPTIGIPYAPDKLPSRANVSKAMKWSVCDRPGSDAKQGTVNQAVFLTGGKEAAALEAKDRMLDIDQALLVQQVDDQQVSTQPTAGQGAAPKQPNLYLVDAQGRKHLIGTEKSDATERRALQTAVFGPNAEPQPVKKEWLDTLATGTPVTFPELPGMDVGAKQANSTVALQKAEDRRVGRVVKYGDKHYVVGKDQLFALTAFQAELFLQNPKLVELYKGKKDPAELTSADHASFGAGVPNDGKLPSVAPDWPAKSGVQANNWKAPKDARLVVCSTFDGVGADGRTPKRSVWAGTEYPARFNSSSGSAHVTPGHGLLYRALDGGPDGSGMDYLVTETGLRYSVPANSDGGKGAAPTAKPGQPGASGAPATPSAQPTAPAGPPEQEEQGGAQARLGYREVKPVPVPKEWSNLIPNGPALNTKNAAQQQDA
ncbi:type VII secretion protein EccB [Kitasatospora sp. NPDC054939]